RAARTSPPPRRRAAAPLRAAALNMRRCAAVIGLAVALVGLASACNDDKRGVGKLVVLEAINPDGAPPTTSDLELSKEVIRLRLEKLGFRNAGVIRRGREIAFQLPTQDHARVLPLLIRTGRLEFFDLQGELARQSLDAQGNPRPSKSPIRPRPKTVVVTCKKTSRYCPG